MGENLRSGRLYGRDVELAVLSGCLRRAAQGEGQVVIVEGEAGIGKTRLLDTALTAVGGFRVIRGAAEELERTAPLLAFARALRAMNPPPGGRLGILTDLLLRPTPSDADPVTPSHREVRVRVLDELALGVEELAAAEPVLVAVEDLQWADPSTLLAVRLLGRRVAQLPMAVVVTLRPTPRSAELSGVVDDLIVVGGVHLTLGPLDADAVANVLADAVGATPGMRLRAQAARAGGNPLFIRELADALVEAELLDVADGRVELREPGLPTSLGPTILRRLRFLPDQTLHALRVAAVLGSSFDLSDLAVCLGRSAVELLPAVQEATQARILSEADGRLAFRHDLIWEVLYQDLAAPVRKALHLEAGRALADAGRPPRQVAPHLAIGAPAGDRQAVQWLQRAARQAAPLAPAVAAELLERALQLADPSDPCRDTLRAELAAALVWSGRPTDAEKLARQALADPAGVATAGSLQWALAEALQVQGRLHEALPYIEAAARHPGLPEGQRARLLADAAQWRFYTGDPDAAATLAHHAVAAGEACSDDIAVCLGLSALSRMATERLDLPEGISLARRAVERARERGVGRTDSTWIHPTFDLGGALLVADELAEAEQVLQSGIRLREELGSTWDLPLFINALAHAHLYAGRWNDAVAEATTVLTLAEEGRASASIMWTYSLLAYVAIHRDDLKAARAILDGAAAVAQGHRPAMGRDQVLWCEALLLAAAADPGAAVELLEQAWKLPLAFKSVTRTRMAPDLVRLAVATGNHPLGRAVARYAEWAAATTHLPLHQGVALRCAGLLRGDPATLERAVAALRASQRPVELAFACEDTAMSLRRSGRPTEAVSLLQESISTYERIGAVRDAARADAALRALGVRRGRRGPRPSARMGWESLTRTEHDVVRLVAQGLTNAEIGVRLFISRRTVETHLSHVFRKLGLTSRVELAAQATRRAQ